MAAEAASLDLVIVRPPAVYGPGDRATLGLVDQLTRRHALLPGRADMRLSLIHSEDLAGALAGLAATDAAGGETLEIDDGREGGYSWADLEREASQALGRRVSVHLLPRTMVGVVGRGADVASRMLGQAFMLSAAKTRELYHPDWVARSPLVSEKTDWTARLGFAEGFLNTLQWYCAAGWLPASRLPEKERQA